MELKNNILLIWLSFLYKEILFLGPKINSFLLIVPPYLVYKQGSPSLFRDPDLDFALLNTLKILLSTLKKN